MAIITTIKTKGNASTSTLSGNIVIDEGAGELRITKKVGDDIVPVNVINETGNHYYDLNGVERISTGLDEATGYIRQLYKDTDGKGSILVGQNPANGKQVIAQTLEGKDVEQELTGGSLMLSTPVLSNPLSQILTEETPEEENA